MHHDHSKHVLDETPRCELAALAKNWKQGRGLAARSTARRRSTPRRWRVRSKAMAMDRVLRTSSPRTCAASCNLFVSFHTRCSISFCRHRPDFRENAEAEASTRSAAAFAPVAQAVAAAEFIAAPMKKSRSRSAFVRQQKRTAPPDPEGGAAPRVIGKCCPKHGTPLLPVAQTVRKKTNTHTFHSVIFPFLFRTSTRTRTAAPAASWSTASGAVAISP